MSTHQRLLEIMSYDPETGIAVWKTGKKAGKQIGYLMYGSKRSHPYRYWKIAEFGSKKPLTHFIFFYMTGKWPAAEMDHKSTDTLDDRWSNLREATRFQNEANKGPNKDNRSGFKGVGIRSDGRFQAKIHRRGKYKVLGYFDTPEAAHAAYVAAASAFDGEFFRGA